MVRRLFEPAGAVEEVDHDYHDGGHEEDDRVVGEFPVEDGHVVEVHAVDAGDQVQREEYGGDDGENLEPVVGPVLEHEVVVLVDVFEPTLVAAEETEAVTDFLFQVFEALPQLADVERRSVVNGEDVRAVELVLDHYVHAVHVFLEVEYRVDVYRQLLGGHLVAEDGDVFAERHVEGVVLLDELGEDVVEEGRYRRLFQVEALAEVRGEPAHHADFVSVYGDQKGGSAEKGYIFDDEILRVLYDGEFEIELELGMGDGEVAVS